MADLHDLLEKTSRTFALSIPYLPEPTRREVTIAYLLFRIADTFEDSATWSKNDRMAALDDFVHLLQEPQPEATSRQATRWAAAVPIDHDGYQELLHEVPFVLDAFFELSPQAQELVREHVARTCRGMAEFVSRSDEQGELQLVDLEDLQHYCYIVAGIVGEMLTELFLLDREELDTISEPLRQRSRAFGEALQLVNILRDAAFDSTEGRSYLPRSVGRDALFELARRDLEASVEYVLTLQRGGADRGLVAFNAVQVLLALATIDKVERKGPGSKISRTRVFWLLRRMEQALDKGEPVIRMG